MHGIFSEANDFCCSCFSHLAPQVSLITVWSNLSFLELWKKMHKELKFYCVLKADIQPRLTPLFFWLQRVDFFESCSPHQPQLPFLFRKRQQDSDQKCGDEESFKCSVAFVL